jgi:hypothetical protein
MNCIALHAGRHALRMHSAMCLRARALSVLLCVAVMCAEGMDRQEVQAREGGRLGRSHCEPLATHRQAVPHIHSKT